MDIPHLYYVNEKDYQTYFHPRVLELMKKPQPVQRSPEWYQLRRNAVTASNIGSVLLRDDNTCNAYVKLFNLERKEIVNPKRSCDKYSTVNDYIKKMTQEEQPFTGNDATWFGQKYEPIVQTIYMQMYGIDLLEFGLLAHETCSILAASPDGIDANGVMVEIKCPSSRPVGPIPPLWYYQQMQLQLETCDLQLCRFFDAHFLEYLHPEDWEEDSNAFVEMHPDLCYHRFGIALEDPSNVHTYYYAPPTVITPEQFKEWTSEKSLEYFDEHGEYPKKHYYHLNEFHIVDVPREKGWLERNMPRIEQVWSQVLEKRRNPVPLKKQGGRTSATQKVKNTAVFSECLC